MKRKCLVLTLLLMFGCGGCTKKIIMKLPQEYKQAVNNYGNVFATIPSGATLVDALDALECGKQYTCVVADLGRVFYVSKRSNVAFLQTPTTEPDLTKVVKCGEKYLCLIDQTTSTITLLKRKP